MKIAKGNLGGKATCSNLKIPVKKANESPTDGDLKKTHATTTKVKVSSIDTNSFMDGKNFPWATSSVFTLFVFVNSSGIK